MSAIIEIEPIHTTTKGQRYRVWHNGEVLLKSARDPEHEAARELSKIGVTGRLQTKRKGRDQIDMEGLIAVMATQTIIEGDKIQPRLAKWSPHWAASQKQTQARDIR